MSRRLRDDERELWDRLRQTVKPLRKKPAAKARAEAAAHAQGPARPAPAATSAPPVAKRPVKSASPAPKPAPATFDMKTRRALARGRIEIDAKIDLHGMHQERAHAALAEFIRRAEAADARIVLVVTGKGGEAGRGVLRANVPSWLGQGELGRIVGGFEEAHRRHGGGGALYVRLRRRRAGARRSPA